jgi:hypothetical protein
MRISSSTGTPFGSAVGRETALALLSSGSQREAAAKVSLVLLSIVIATVAQFGHEECSSLFVLALMAEQKKLARVGIKTYTEQ